METEFRVEYKVRDLGFMETERDNPLACIQTHFDDIQLGFSLIYL